MLQVHIYFTKFNQKLSNSLWDQYINLLPADQKEKNSRFERWQDRHLHLFGKLLLIEGLKLYGFDNGELKNISYNKNDRPYLRNTEIDFNISHSGNYVICAISCNSKIGIDIEEIKSIAFIDFKNVFSIREWSEIEKSSDPTLKFFNFWTRKESAIKADGRGLSMPLDQINVIENLVNIDNQNLYLTDLNIDKGYCTCLATNIECLNIRVVEIDFFESILIKNDTFID
jgi:4'-phosphopantetheinyl transferase